MIQLPLDISPMSAADLAVVEKLDERVFGPGRFARSAYRLREGVMPAYDLSFVARIGTMLVGANRMTPILCGPQPALLLGPLTVETAFRARGIGGMLMKAVLGAAQSAGHSRVLLVGDLAYYRRFGFSPFPLGTLQMPGPVDPARLLHCELISGAFAETKGVIARA